METIAQPVIFDGEELIFNRYDISLGFGRLWRAWHNVINSKRPVRVSRRLLTVVYDVLYMLNRAGKPVSRDDVSIYIHRSACAKCADIFAKSVIDRRYGGDLSKWQGKQESRKNDKPCTTTLDAMNRHFERVKVTMRQLGIEIRFDVIEQIEGGNAPTSFWVEGVARYVQVFGRLLDLNSKEFRLRMRTVSEAAVLPDRRKSAFHILRYGLAGTPRRDRGKKKKRPAASKTMAELTIS